MSASQPPPPPETNPKEESTFAIGQTLGHSKQFTIARLLGRGGFGEVFLADEQRARRQVAIKTMLPKHNDDKKNLRRFKAEYTLGSLLSHPSLVRMFDLCESPEGVHYIVMEFIEGETLSARMYQQEKEAGQLGVDAALHIGWQIGSLFAQLHERRIIHRDLKPANIVVTQDSTIHGNERYKLIDFGIAKLIDKKQASDLQLDNNTTTGKFLGTVPLMSPESFKGGKAQGPEVDVYSLGCMLYRSIAGSYPFGSDSSVEVIMHHMNDEPIPLTAEDPLLPHDIADMIHSMLAKDPVTRPTMAQVAEFFARKLGLAPAAAGQVIVRGGTQQLQAVLGDFSTGTATPTASGSVSMQAVDGQNEPSGQNLAAPRTQLSYRKRRTMVGLALGVVAILVLGAVTLRNIITSNRSAHSAMASPTQPATLLPSTHSDKVAGSGSASVDLGSYQGPAPAATPVLSSGRATKPLDTKHRPKKKKDPHVVSDE